MTFLNVGNYTLRCGKLSIFVQKQKPCHFVLFLMSWIQMNCLTPDINFVFIYIWESPQIYLTKVYTGELDLSLWLSNM